MLSGVWAGASALGVARALEIPTGADVITVGGATLGGSWKTPVALAVARAISARRAVAFVGHAYRGDVGAARCVSATDDVRCVGDEALACARSFADAASGSMSVAVFVGRSRQAAVHLAASRAATLVIDGPLQLRPRRARLSLLAVDAADPWGSGWCPPRGNLRTRATSLLEACDAVVAVGADGHGEDSALTGLAKPVYRAGIGPPYVVRQSQRLPLTASTFRGLRLGLWTSIARPQRLWRYFAARGLTPAVVLAGADHRPPSPAERAMARRAGVDVWLCTTKCQLHLGVELAGSPVYALELEVLLPARLRACL
jgi:tetraacyldisaccharide 4'-kinase